MPVETDEDLEAMAALNARPDTDEEGGRSIDDRAAEEGEDAEDAPIPPMKQPLVGSTPKLPHKMGGTPPTESEVRLLGGKLPITGSFLKGEEILLLVRAKLNGAGEFDAQDDWGAVTKTTRRHFARMIEVRRLTPNEGGGYDLADQQTIPGL